MSVKTLKELRSVLRPFIEGQPSNQVDLSTKMNWSDENGKMVKGEVRARSRDITVRSLLIEGFDLVKQRMELARSAMEISDQEDEDDLVPEKIRWGLFNVDDQYFHVDGLIKKEMGGGKRRGLRVRWELEDGIFEFDPYKAELYKVQE